MNNNLKNNVGAQLGNQNAKKSDNLKNNAFLQIRCKRSNKAGWSWAAKNKGGLSAWAINVLNQAAENEGFIYKE